MDKKIGKFLCLMLTFMALMQDIRGAQHIKLTLLDMNDKKIDTVTAGVPFKLFVNADIDNDDEYKARLHTPESWNIINTIPHTSFSKISHMRVKKEAYYTFIVRCDEVGLHPLGPVIVESTRESFTSDTLMLDVKAPESSVDEKAPVFLKMLAKKQSAYVGEKIPITISLYSRLSNIDDVGLTRSDMSDSYSIVNTYKRLQTMQKLAQGEYTVYTWRLDIVARSGGKLVIPVFEASFRHWAGYPFLNPAPEYYSLFSNALMIEVQPLPPFNKPVDSVGTFTDFCAQVDRSAMTMNQAVVLSLSLTGHADFNALTKLRLSFPDGVKYFESTTYTAAEGDQEKKVFEYIVQPQETGELVIGSQEFTYFDTDAHRYVTRTTEPLTITVSPAVASDIESHPVMPRSSEPASSTSDEDFVSLPSSPRSRPGLPWWFMVMCCVGLALGGTWPMGGKYHKQWVLEPYEYYRAFARARREIHQAEADQAPDRLYTIFTQLLARRLKIVIPLIHEQGMQRLMEKEIPVDMCHKWQEFFSTLTEHHYSPKKEAHAQELFHDARVWIDEFEKYR